MKKFYYSFISLFLFTVCGHTQTVLFSENFNSGTSSKFTLNTFDLGCAGDTARNLWTINNAYLGGTGQGSINCALLGTLPVFLNETTTTYQPSGITGSPQSYYLHIYDTTATQIGVRCASFINADGICIPAENSFVKMNSGVNTQGLKDITMIFWWLCEGGNGNYGRVYYSTDSGSSWIQIDTPISEYNNTVNWKKQVIALPEFNNVNDLRFAFMWANMVNDTSFDPSFSIDDVTISVGYPASVSELNSTNETISIFPNPAQQYVTVSNNGGENIKQIILTNTIGQVFSVKNITDSHDKAFDIQLPDISGLYFICIKCSNSEVIRKVIRN